MVVFIIEDLISASACFQTKRRSSTALNAWKKRMLGGNGSLETESIRAG